MNHVPIKMPCQLLMASLLLAFFILAGCGPSTDYHFDARSYSVSMVKELEKEDEQKIQTPLLEGRVEISFEEACRRATATDPYIQDILAEIKKSWLNIDAADSRLWPRLEAGVEGEYDLEGKSNDEFNVTGGVFFKYDIWKAVAAGNEEALRRAQLEKNFILLNSYIEKNAAVLLQNLASIRFLDFSIQTKEESRQFADRGVGLTLAYAKENRREGGNLFDWRKRFYVLKGELQQLKNQRQETYNKLKAMLKVPLSQEVIITDLDDILGNIRQIPETPLTTSQIWGARVEARLAEIALIAAKVNMKLASMDNLPKIDATLGVGSIPLTSDDEESRSLLKLSVTLPLWDAGDHERKMANARITLDLVKSRMRLKAAELQEEARRAQSVYESAVQRYKQIEMYSKELGKMHEGKLMLFKEGRLNTLDTLGDAIELNEVAIQENEAKFKVAEAEALYRSAIGIEITEKLAPFIESYLLATGGMEQNKDTDTAQPFGDN